MNFLEKRLKEKYPYEEADVLEYDKSRKPAVVQCRKCGKIIKVKKANNLLHKSRVCLCPQCGKPITEKDKLQDAINKKYPREDFYFKTFSSPAEPFIVKCQRCRTELEFQNAEEILNPERTHLCTHCGFNKKEQLEKTRNNFRKFIAETDMFTDFEEVPQDAHLGTLISSTCLICGKRVQLTMTGYMKGKGCECQRIGEAVNEKEYCRRLGESYKLSSPAPRQRRKSYKDIDTSALIQHSCGFAFRTKAKFVSCPQCKLQGEKGEMRIWFKQHNFSFVENYEKKGKIYDFYLPDYNILISDKYKGKNVLNISNKDEILLKLNEHLTKKSNSQAENCPSGK